MSTKEDEDRMRRYWSDRERSEYRLYVAESKACGYEFVSWDEWTGKVTGRELAESRLSRED